MQTQQHCLCNLHTQSQHQLHDLLKPQSVPYLSFASSNVHFLQLKVRQRLLNTQTTVCVGYLVSGMQIIEQAHRSLCQLSWDATGLLRVHEVLYDNDGECSRLDAAGIKRPFKCQQYLESSKKCQFRVGAYTSLLAVHIHICQSW